MLPLIRRGREFLLYHIPHNLSREKVKKNNFIFLPKPLDIPIEIAYNKGKLKERRIEKMVQVIVKDIRCCENNYLELTDDQYRLLEWLDNKEFMEDVKVEVVDSYEFQRI